MPMSTINKKEVDVFLITEIEEFASSGSCVECADYVKRKCSFRKCPHIIDKIKLGAKNYKTMIKDCFAEVDDYNARKRLNQLAKKLNGSMFISDIHMKNFNQINAEISKILENPSNKYLTTLYLFVLIFDQYCADEVLWNFSREAIYLKRINFDSIHLTGVSTETYALYKTAKTIYEDESALDWSEIGDNEIITNELFKAIINSLLIYNYGIEILNLDIKQLNQIKKKKS